MIKKLLAKIGDFEKTLQTLESALGIDDKDIKADVCIKRFEYCYDLSWKCIKIMMSYKGFDEVKSPRDAFKEAYKQKWIDDEKLWMNMIDNRNLTAHTYNLFTAQIVFNMISDYHIAMKNLLKELKEAI